MTYQLIDLIIAQNEEAMSAAEAHGVATGMLCVDARADGLNWLQNIFTGDVSLTDEEKNLLLDLFERTRELLASEGFEYELFLPDDDNCMLRVEAEALQQWCQGFLYGIGYANASGDWPGEMTEILHDIVEISKLDPAVQGEEDEQAIMEIEEYLRACVLLIREEMYGQGTARQLH